MFGYVIGQGALADAYTIGNETPNIVYELLIGGVLSATLVPLFTSYVERDDQESTDVVITVTLAILAAVTLVAVVAAPWIFRLYTIDPAADVDAAEFREVGTLLTRVFLLQIFFYGATGLATALLNARRRFFAAAWCPILSNVVVIVTLLALPSAGTAGWTLSDVLTDDRLRWTLGIGATAGIAAMALVLVPAVHHAGVRFHPRLAFRHPAVRRLLQLSGWTLGYVIANQITVIVVRNLADPGSGDNRAYFNAFTFFVLPHGLLAVSIATTFAPEMARSVTRRDRAAFCRQASLGTRLVAALTFPAGVLIFVLRRTIVGAFLEYGEYSRRTPTRGPCPRRVRPGTRRVLGVPVRAPRLLRPPGHAHTVRHQRGAERHQHRPGVRPRRFLRHPRPRRRAGDLVPRVRRLAIRGVLCPVASSVRIARRRRTRGTRSPARRRGRGCRRTRRGRTRGRC